MLTFYCTCNWSFYILLSNNKDKAWIRFTSKSYFSF